MIDLLRRGIFCLLALSLAGCNAPSAAPQQRPRPVRIETVRLQDYAPTIAVTGEIRARVQADLSFRVSGRVSERLADVGRYVTPNEVLARIEPREQEADFEAANAAVTAAEAQLSQTTSAFDRQKMLLGRGFTTRASYDQAEAAQRTAEGSLTAAKAQAATAKDALSYTELRAGTTGVITARNVEVGQVAQAAQPVFTLAEDGPRDAVFFVQESIFLQEHGDGAIELVLVSDPSVTAKGKVREVAPTVDTRTGTVRVKIGIDDIPPAMTLGSAVTGIARSASRKAIILPWSALTAAGADPAVWTIDPSTRKTTLQPIEIDTYEAATFVIRSGLKPGDVVVTDGGKLLRPNQAVTVLAEEAP